VEDTSMNFWLLQRGQSAQPSPEPDSRTAAPVTTIAHNRTRAAKVTRE